MSTRVCTLAIKGNLLRTRKFTPVNLVRRELSAITMTRTTLIIVFICAYVGKRLTTGLNPVNLSIRSDQPGLTVADHGCPFNQDECRDHCQQLTSCDGTQAAVSTVGTVARHSSRIATHDSYFSRVSAFSGATASAANANRRPQQLRQKSV